MNTYVAERHNFVNVREHFGCNNREIATNQNEALTKLKVLLIIPSMLIIQIILHQFT